jgi:uncharacterized protein
MIIEKKSPPGFNPEDITPPPLIERNWRISALALDVAGNCNLACRYCAEASTQPQRPPMTPPVLKAAWSFLFPDDKPHKGYSIRLGSGEPLLALPLLHRLAELVNTHGKDRPAVFLTTNGTLVDRKTSAWLAASGWHVKVSLDGPQDVHDAWRVTPRGEGTYAKVAPVVENLAKKIPELLSVTAVLCRGTDPRQVFEAIAELGVKRIELVPVSHSNRNIQPEECDIKRYEAFTTDYVRRYLEDKDDGNFPILVRLARSVTRVMGYNNQRIACGAGRSFLGVGPDGGLYPCFRFIGIESYRLGSLDTGPEAKDMATFQKGPGRPYNDRTPCRDCWAAPLCAGPCFAVAEMFGPSNGSPLDYHCAYNLADARAAVRLVNELRKRDPSRLLSFLPGGLR